MKEANVEELARRAVACRHWRWMPGMRVARGRVAGRVLDAAGPFVVADFDGPTRDGGGRYDGPVASDMLPDLTDPATLGCLLALVREAWGEPLIYVERGAVDRVTAPLADPICEAHTEAAALVAALEAAP